MEPKYKIKEEEIIVTLMNNIVLEGTVNIMEYNRFSDFIENDKTTHIKLYNARKESSIAGATKRFVLIPKANVAWYEPRPKR